MSEIINLCDVCTFCGRRCQGETHFPLSCTEKNLWDRRSQVTDADIKRCFDRTEELLCNLEDLREIIRSKKSLYPHLQETVNLLYWTRILLCFNPQDEVEVDLTLASIKNAVEAHVVFFATEGKARKARINCTRRVLELLGWLTSIRTTEGELAALSDAKAHHINLALDRV